MHAANASVVPSALADAFLEKFGGDGLEEVRHNYRAYQDSLRSW